jgi:hypothetical protein
VSGNPSGKRKQDESKRKLDGMKDMVLKEAFRPVRVREGERTVTLPAIQASLRSHFMSAARGDRKAFSTTMSLVSAILKENDELQLQHFAAALDYKNGMEMELARRKREGIMAPDPIPHPDDIILDPRTGEVTIKGPLTENERAFFEETRRRHAELRQGLQVFQEELATTRNKAQRKLLTVVTEQIKVEMRRLADFINTHDSDRNRID